MKTIEKYRKNSGIRTNLYSATLYELLDILTRKVAEDMREECAKKIQEINPFPISKDDTYLIMHMNRCQDAIRQNVIIE